MARVTLQTIADAVGVSRMTVSNAFSRPDQLSEELRARILEAARELGYVGPDPLARALVRGTTGAVGVLLTDSLRYAFTDEVATGFLAAIVDELAHTGLALTLLTDGKGDALPARDVAIDGAIVYSCRPESASRAWLLRRRLPLVFVDQDPLDGVTCVNVEDRAGARAAADHLLGLGHRSIGIVTLAPEAGAGDDDAGVPHPQRERMRGWLDALSAAGVEPRVVLAEQHADDDALVAGRELLAAEPRPTAVLCFSDVLALGVLRAASEAGLEVPADLSVVGFDDSPLATRHEPGITTVRQDVVAKGELVGRLLIGAIDQAAEGERAEAPHVRLATELLVRGTTAAAPHR